MLKIFTGKIPENPYKINMSDNEWERYFKGEKERYYAEGQQSILNQLKEVDLNTAFRNYVSAIPDPDKWMVTFLKVSKSFEQFIQEQIKKQVGKDGC